ncbi:MAG: hydrogenase maturation protease [Phycisphaerae bacterium]|jgi:hydrogenase maturation protease
MKNEIAVVGLGNTIMADEGIGCVIAEVLSKGQAKYPGVEFIEAGCGGINLLHIMAERKKVIIIDCAIMGTEPGKIKRFTPEQAQSVKKLAHFSLHEVDVMKVIEMARRLNQCPEEIIIFGIEPQKVEHGRELSDVLSRRLNEYVAIIEKELGGD